MSPELQQLLEAYHDKRTCPPEEKPQRAVTFERLLSNALAKGSGISRDELLNALAERYAEFRRQRIRSERDRLSRLR